MIALTTFYTGQEIYGDSSGCSDDWAHVTPTSMPLK